MVGHFLTDVGQVDDVIVNVGGLWGLPLNVTTWDPAELARYVMPLEMLVKRGPDGLVRKPIWATTTRPLSLSIGAAGDEVPSQQYKFGGQNKTEVEVAMAQHVLGWRLYNRSDITTAVYDVFVSRRKWPAQGSVYMESSSNHHMDYVNDVLNAALLELIVPVAPS